MTVFDSLQFGDIKRGPQNLITDVPGVRVGHCTLSKGDIQTGVTAVIPHEGNIFKEKVLACAHVINGFGKSAGLMQINELGTLETPVVLTNTFAVGTAVNALIKYSLQRNPDIGLTTGTVNPVVLECNDGFLNDIRSMPVGEEHVRIALETASVQFALGSVGAGMGMSCYGLKGGIGSSSRLILLDDSCFTLGCLVLSNFGSLSDLTVLGKKAAPEDRAESSDKGSVIIIIATDIPMSDRQLLRMCKRAVNGLARTGSYTSNGSGEIALGFTTANRVYHYSEKHILSQNVLHEECMDIIFRSVSDSVEESVINSMLYARPATGRAGHQRRALSEMI
ncbi:MAG: Peptidase family S58 [Firmicutes bacterium ADurb.Bin182]|nr:MAG: Peptidase family S58 [Firmicutes bacterium ADurb.Bin182]